MKKKIFLFLDLIRFNKPVGTFLLALPCWFEIILASKNSANFSSIILLKMLFLFTIGAFLMRSAGCIINDIFDHKIDAKVARTRLRPLASGALQMQEALIFLFLLLLGAFVILLQFNFYTIVAGFVAVGLVAIYPLMKRVTFYPQIFLGLVFNCGILMADLAINKRISISSILLFLACIIWTLIYDTIYAFQDIEDDLKIGVKSSAIKFANNPKQKLIGLNIIMFFIIFILGVINNFSLYFYIFILIAALYELYLIAKCKYSSAHSCLKGFRGNIFVGFFILLAIIFS